MKRIISVLLIIWCFTGCFNDDKGKKTNIVNTVEEPKITTYEGIKLDPQKYLLGDIGEKKLKMSKYTAAKYLIGNTQSKQYLDDYIVWSEDKVMRVNKKMEIVWEYIGTADMAASVNSLIVNNDEAYVTWRDDNFMLKFLSLDCKTGKVIEAYDTNDTGLVRTNNLTFVDNKIFFIGVRRATTEEGIHYLASFDVVTKKVEKYIEFEKTNIYNGASVCIENNIAYFGMVEGWYNSGKVEPDTKAVSSFYAYDLTNKKTLWRYILPKGTRKSQDWIYTDICGPSKKYPGVIVNNKFIGSVQCGLICLDKNTGEKIWSCIAPFDVPEGSGTDASEEGPVYDKETNTVLTVGVGYDGGRTGLIDRISKREDGEHKIFCVDADTGVVKWSYGNAYSGLIIPAVYGGYAYMPDSEKVFVINIKTGNLVASLDYVTNNHVVEKLYFEDGMVYGFGGTMCVFEQYKKEGQ
jgi:outer membrane protein assembly factor BamB